jgi:hypothetical protein
MKKLFAVASLAALMFAPSFLCSHDGPPKECYKASINAEGGAVLTPIPCTEEPTKTGTPLPAWAVKAPSTKILLNTETGSYAGLGYADPHLAAGVGIEQKIQRHLELQGGISFSPDHKQDSKTGHEMTTGSSVIYWATPRFGIIGGVRHSNLWTARYAKSANEIAGGIAFKAYAFGTPGRYYFQYVTQIGKDYDAKTGIEGNHLKCGELYAEYRMANLGPTTLRFGPRVDVCHGLTQGNPLQDGTLGPATAPRGSFFSGAVAVVFKFELGRRSLDVLY